MSETLTPGHRARRAIDTAIEFAERATYLLVGLVLVAAAVVSVCAIGYELAVGLEDGALDAVKGALDGLLLVFILVELLGAVRETVAKRQLLAEPFLVVGIIASIKEIVVASLKAGSLEGDDLETAMLEIGVLGGVVLFLALAGWLIRRKEREPEEDD